MATQWTAGTASGQILTAAKLNTIGAAWETYTPTLTQGVAIAKTVNYARYCQIQTTVIVEVLLTTTAGGLGGAIIVSFPSGLTPVTLGETRAVGSFLIRDTGTAYYSGTCIANTSGFYGLAYGSTSNMGNNTPAFTIISNDQISISVTYEVA